MNSSFKIQTGVRIPELDGLRGLAILSVLFYHYVFEIVRPEDGWLSALVRTVFPLTWSGVDLFFVLSGFLIGGILLDQRQTKNYFKAFYLRRICRIFPFYFLWLTLFFILPIMISPRSHQVLSLFDSGQVPKWTYVLFLQNFPAAMTGMLGPGWIAPTWSLAVEEQFYLLTPLMIWFTPIRKLPYLLVSLIASVPIFRLYLYLFHSGTFAYVLLPCRADALLIGILCACWVRNETALNRLANNRERLYLALIILLAGTGYLTHIANAQDSFNGILSFEMVFLGYSWLAVFYACLLLIVITAKHGVITAVMRFKPLRYLGIVSYSLYLMHMAVLSLTFDLILGKNPHLGNFTTGIVTMMALLITLLLATLSWHFFERPIIRWGHTFSYRTEPQPAIKAPVAI